MTFNNTDWKNNESMITLDEHADMHLKPAKINLHTPHMYGTRQPYNFRLMRQDIPARLFLSLLPFCISAVYCNAPIISTKAARFPPPTCLVPALQHSNKVLQFNEALQHCIAMKGFCGTIGSCSLIDVDSGCLTLPLSSSTSFCPPSPFSLLFLTACCNTRMLYPCCNTRWLLVITHTCCTLVVIHIGCLL